MSIPVWNLSHESKIGARILLFSVVVVHNKIGNLVMRPSTTQIKAAETIILVTDGTGVNNFYYILDPL